MSIKLGKFPRCSECGAQLDMLAELPPHVRTVECRYCKTKVPLISFAQEAAQHEKKLDELRQDISKLQQDMETASREMRRRAQEHFEQLQQELKSRSLEYKNSQLEQLYNLFCLGEDARNTQRYEEAKTYYTQALALRHALKKHTDEAALHWHILECEFGVEYVPEVGTNAYLPTLTGIQVDDVLENPHFRSILVLCHEAGDDALRLFYEQKAQRLNAILKKYQQLSASEPPYDVFISVKQGDEHGKMTSDADVALELYHELSAQGLLVFNSRKKLKAGEEYEPYIMHAMHTATLMVVVASCEEHLNAPWLRNEWRRFRWLKESEGSDSARRLIVYSTKLGDPLTLLEFGAGLQRIEAQHEAEPLQKLCRRAMEICRNRPALSAQTERIFIELGYGEFGKAKELCEQALNADPKNGYAYLGKLMIELGVRTQEELGELKTPFDSSKHFLRIMDFGDNALKRQVQEYIRLINERNEYNRKKDICRAVLTDLRGARTVEQCRKIAKRLDGLNDFAEADAARTAVQTKIAQIHSGIYEKAVELKRKKEWQKAIEVFRTIVDVRDSREQIAQCEDAILDARYNEALSAMRRREFRNAEAAFAALGDYRDSKQRCTQCNISAQEEDKRLELDALRQKLQETEAQLCSLRQSDTERSEQYTALQSDRNRLEREATSAQQQAEAFRKERDSLRASTSDSRNTQNALVNTVNEVQAQHQQTKERLAQVEAELDEAEGELTKLHSRNEMAGMLLKATLLSLLFGMILATAISCFRLQRVKDQFANGQTAEALLSYRSAAVYANNPPVGFLFNVAEALMKPSDELKAALDETVRRFDRIEAGSYHTLGIGEDGAVVAAGYNYEGQCLVGEWTNIAHLAAGVYHTVGLHTDGTVVAAGNNEDGQCDVTDWTYITDIDAGDYHTVGLRMDGTVVATGRNAHGQCDVSDWRDIIAVSTGGFYTVGLKADGRVVATGHNTSGQCNLTAYSLVAVAAGFDFTVGLRWNGEVVAVGNNEFGQCDVSEWKSIVAIAAGADHAVALKTDGTVVAAGRNDDGQCNVGEWTDIVAINAGYYHTVGLKEDGTVVAVGRFKEDQLNVSEWNLMR